jgi:hypothetical protein
LAPLTRNSQPVTVISFFPLLPNIIGFYSILIVSIVVVGISFGGLHFFVIEYDSNDLFWVYPPEGLLDRPPAGVVAHNHEDDSIHPYGQHERL